METKPIEYVQPQVAEAYYEQSVEPETALKPTKIDDTACSCVKSARVIVPNLPRGDAGNFIPNTDMQKGQLAILDYNGVKHITAYKITPNGLQTVHEGNYKPCEITSRIISWEEVNEHIVGFYAIPATSGDGQD